MISVLNDCRLPYNQMMVLTLLLCCFVVILIIVQSEELGYSSQLMPSIKFLIPQIDKVYFYQLETKNWTFIISERFLSFSIDSSELYHGLKNPSLRDKRLIRLVAHLGGGYLRVGGNAADQLLFRPAARSWPRDYLPLEGGPCSYANINCPNMTKKNSKIKQFSMSAMDWVEINDFCTATGLKLLFDLNVLVRTNDSWDCKNAELLFDYSFSQNFSIDWELGNEPNSFPHEFGVDLTPGRLAIDYTVLRQLLYRYTLYRDSLLIGPSTTNPHHNSLTENPDEYLRLFLGAGADVDVISWHFYYIGPNATVEDFLNPALYDSLGESIDIIHDAVKESGISPRPIWIGETGSAYGGGVSNLTDRFVASLLHLDKLGTAAARGMSVVVRQSLYRGFYCLINPTYMTPNGDFWVSVLFKQLVGRKVLNISELSRSEGNSGTSQFYLDRTIPLRLYAHCSTSRPYPVIYGVNLNNETLGISLFSNNTGHLYSVKGYPDLLSQKLELNGVKLKLGKGQSLPYLSPIVLDLREPVPIRPHSLFFLVSHNNLTLCQHSVS